MHRVFACGSNRCLRDLGRFLREGGHGGLGEVRVHAGLLAGHRLVWNYYSPLRDGGGANADLLATPTADGPGGCRDDTGVTLGLPAS